MLSAFSCKKNVCCWYSLLLIFTSFLTKYTFQEKAVVMFSSDETEKLHMNIRPPTVLWKSSMKNYVKKDKSINLNSNLRSFLPKLGEDKKNIFPFKQKSYEEVANKNDRFNRIADLANKENIDPSEKILGFGKKRQYFEDCREFSQDEDEERLEMATKKVIYRRKVTSSHGRIQNGQKVKPTEQTTNHHGLSRLHRKRETSKDHKQFYVTKKFLGQLQQEFQKGVQRQQAALSLYRQWQLQIREEFEELQRIHQNITPSDSRLTMMKKIKANMAARTIRVGFRKSGRRPSMLQERKKGEVKISELRRYLDLLEKSDTVSRFLERDSCFRVSDKYLVAAAFVYFKRAGYTGEMYTPRRFFVSLYLANDMEEDEEDLKYEIFRWAIGEDESWNEGIQEFLNERDRLFREIGQRGVVSRICCEEIMAIIPSSKVWLRNRLLHHAGGARNSTILIKPKPIEAHSSSNGTHNNPHHKINGDGSKYYGIVEPVQPLILSPKNAPSFPCLLCHPELASIPPKNCPSLSLFLRQNPTLECPGGREDMENSKVIRCCFNSSFSADYSELSFSPYCSFYDDDDGDEEDEEDTDNELLLWSESLSPLF